MKYLLSALVLFVLLPAIVKGQQNHVPNASFEDTIACPQFVAQFNNYVASWYSFQQSPDYFCRCGPPNWSGVPFNAFGFQDAIGNSYCGLVAGDPYTGGSNSYNEYIYAHILPLKPGNLYNVSLSVSLSNKSSGATDNLGVYFFDTTSLPPLNSKTLLNIIPQVYYSSYGAITDTQNWVRLSNTFFVDSAYDNMVIGGFGINGSYTWVPLSNASSNHAYYYIDSIVVVTIDSFYITSSDSLLCAGDTLHLSYYSPAKFANNNVFVVELSDNTGSFVLPTAIGTLATDTSGTITCVLPNILSSGIKYKIRIKSTNPSFIVDTVNYNIKITSPDSFLYGLISNSPVCAGSQVILSVSSTISPNTYQWTGPSGFNSTLQNPVINGAVPANGGDYYATLKFYGCEVKDTLSVTVKPLPVKPVANNNSPLCAGDSLHLSSSSSTSGVSYSWAGPGSFASSAQDTSVANSTTATSGDYIVTANLNGCNRKDTTTVLVKPLPAAVTLSNNTPICAGDTLHLSSTTSTTGSTYSWSGPGSFTASIQNTNRANTTAGMTGWYKMLAGLNGCTYADSTYATIHPIPSLPNISYTNPLCVGEPLNLGTATVSGASYSWAGPGNFSSSSPNPTRSNMQFGDTGSYKLAMTVNGCTSDTAAATVHINPLPFVVIFANPADSICQGDRVNFTALPNNHGGSPAYQWYVNGQTAGTGTVFSTTALNDQDVVRCDMTENTKCSVPYTDPSNDVTMTVVPVLAPSVTITANPNRPLKENEYVTFTAIATNAGNNPQYQWKRNGQDIVGATGSIWSANTLNDNDSISVKMVSNYKCPQPPGAQSNGIVVKVLTGVAGMNEITSLMLYPNPNNGKFILSGRLNTRERVKLEVINAVGKTVFEGNTETQNGILYHEIALPCAPAGLYMLRVKADEGLAVFKIQVR